MLLSALVGCGPSTSDCMPGYEYLTYPISDFYPDGPPPPGITCQELCGKTGSGRDENCELKTDADGAPREVTCTIRVLCAL